jgi:3-oxoacyl-[acyl-carrier-protein] synthase II
MSVSLVITGLGSISSAGATAGALESTLLAGRSCLAVRADPRFPLAAQLPVGLVSVALPAGPRAVGLAEVAAREALAVSGAAPGRLGLAVGSCTGGLHGSEESYLGAGPEPVSEAYRDQPVGRIMAALRRRLRIRGPVTAHAEACASAAGALIEAISWIRTGLVPGALIIGTDPLTRLTMAGFHALQIVDPVGCRPFSEERAGMSLGEGAVALVLEEEGCALRRGAKPLARLLGWGMAGDAHHATAPDPSGRWLDAAIGQSLQDAAMAASDIGFISAHGTGTRDNDVSEAHALATRFGHVPVSSNKRALGHTMGASALFGVAGAVVALRHQTLLPIADWSGTPFAHVDVVTHARAGRFAAALTTCLAFGGVNTAFVVGRA